MKYNTNIKNIQCYFIISFLIFIISCEPKYDSFQQFPEPNSVDNYYVYNLNQKYSDVLIECTLIASGTCSLTTLPFIGIENEYPTINDIMNRLIISHSWMGQNFKEFLAHFPKEALALFRSITAIVITGNIRPAQYSSQTSVIFLDPQDLWLTRAEYHSMSKEKDYRSNFGNILSFNFLRRALQYNMPVYKHSQLIYKGDRNIQNIMFPLSSTLFHELAHANDYFHHATLKSYKRNVPISSLNPTTQSGQLNKIYSDFGLSSNTLYMLAAKKYRYLSREIDTTPPQEVASKFFRDGASDFYGYTTGREDFAMLFEAVMSKKFFNVEYEIAFTNNPKSTTDCKEHIIVQGTRNRIAAPLVKKRALRVVKNVLPSIDWDTFLETKIGRETSLTQGKNWCFTSSE